MGFFWKKENVPQWRRKYTFQQICWCRPKSQQPARKFSILSIIIINSKIYKKKQNEANVWDHLRCPSVIFSCLGSIFTSFLSLFLFYSLSSLGTSFPSHLFQFYVCLIISMILYIVVGPSSIKSKRTNHIIQHAFAEEGFFEDMGELDSIHLGIKCNS